MARDQAPLEAGDTAATILDVAQGLVQTRGYNGFSYADIAATLGITKAALHYHYPTKAALGRALFDRYSGEFFDALRVIDQARGTSTDRLLAYVSLYVDVVAGDRMCLCGMLATERNTLPDSMRVGVVDFFDANVDWLEGVLTAGTADGSLQLRESPRDAAELLLGGLEGIMLIAWSQGDPRRFRASAARLVASLTQAA